MKFTPKRLVRAILLFAVLGQVIFTQAFFEAVITTDKKRYDVGETMTINGTGFSPSAVINISVLRPDKLTDYVTGVNSDITGSFTAQYTPSLPHVPGRYRITATDGVNSANTATTEADAIGYKKRVFNKATTDPNGATGTWTTGNAGGNYREGQWVFYQYQVTGITSASSVPSFDITFNHFQSNTNAVFVDAFANFRACIDCTDQTETSGNSAGLLLDNVSHPPADTTNWKIATPAISNINGTFVNDVCGAPGSDGKNTPAQFHCFKVTGSLLAALFPPGVFSSGTHTITLFYEAHLAKSTTWQNGKEYLLGCVGPYYVAPRSDVQPPNTAYGTNAYSGSDPCNDPAGADDWDGSFNGVGFATGSSRQFNIENQSAGSQGALSLPIPTVPAPTGSITIVKVTNPATSAQLFSFSTNTLGSFNLDTDAATSDPTNSKTFSGLTGGDTFTFTETVPTGWALTNLVCVNNTGTSTLNTNLGTATATVTLAETNNAAVTCTFTNTKQAQLRIQKVTIPAGNATNFTFTPTNWNGGSTFTRNGTQGSFASGFLTPGATVYSAVETVVSGWALTDRSCVFTGTATTKTFTPINNGVSLTLGAGEDVTCVFTNGLLPTLLVTKTIQGNSDTFQFTSNTLLGNFSLTPPTGGSASSNSGVPIVIPVGTGTVSETVPTGWMLEPPNCSGGTGAGAPANTATSASFSATYGDTVLCSFVNVQQQGGATRTQGYWATHTDLTNRIWSGPSPLPPPNDTYAFTPVAGSADAELCVSPTAIDATPLPGANEVMGGFWASIAQTSDGKGKNKGQRSDLDKARMQFLQQYLAAVLNVHAFGTPIPGTTLAAARAAYCGSDPAAILAQMALLAAYNESGDIVSIDINGYKGTPQQSREQANIPFWDITFR